MMSSNVALLHSNNCCVLEPAICEDLDLHVVIFHFVNRLDYRHNVDIQVVAEKHVSVIVHIVTKSTF